SAQGQRWLKLVNTEVDVSCDSGEIWVATHKTPAKHGSQGGELGLVVVTYAWKGNT
ncbi:hypothetical protein HAX54_013509, partial [Datura stramonium]|nr:hypothetical protein [Datura stramonium]